MAAVKEGGDNDLLADLAARPEFRKVAGKFDKLADPSRFVGRSAEQVDEFVEGTVAKLLARYGEIEPPQRIEV
jgi:adenylosuccinate lyase